jgi:photosystem II stability/assembly factor-like uncharacterized protein
MNNYVILFAKKHQTMKHITFIILFFLVISNRVLSQTETWTRISPNPIESSLTEIVNIPGTDRMLAVGTGASVLTTSDFGLNWEIQYNPGGISRGVTLNAVSFIDSNIGFIGGTKSTLLKTIDGGNSWQNILPSGTEELLDVYFHDELHGFISKEHVLLRTSDGGNTWDTSYSGQVHPKDVHFVNDTVGFFVGRYGTYYFQTQNNGETWSQVEIFPAIENFEINSILFITKEIGFIAGVVSNPGSYDYFILKTTDGGITWSVVNTDYYIEVSRLYFFNDEIGYAVGPRIMYDNKILRTLDCGATWQECTMPYTYWILNDLCFSDEGIGFCVGTYGQVIKSNDWGENWERTNYAAVHAATINDAQIVDDSTVFIAATGYGGGVPEGSLSKSTDGGNTWSGILNSGDFVSLDFLSPEFGYALGRSFFGEYEVSKTTDGGNSWVSFPIETNYNNPNNILFINDSVGFIGCEWEPVIYKSTDWGESWSINFSEYMNGPVSDIEFISDSVGFAVGPYFEDDRFLLRTTDQGETWSIDTLNFDFYPHRIHFLNNDTGFIAGNNNTILKTIDGGNNWYRVQTPLGNSTIFQDIDFPTNQTGYVLAVGEDIAIIKTADCGETWESMDFPCTSTPFTVDFFSENRGLVTGDRGIIFKTFVFGMVDVPEPQEENGEHSHWISYPNPVKDILHIVLPSTEETDIQNFMFYDSQGRFITKVKTPGNNRIFELDVSQWNNGTYYFNITSQGSSRKGGKFVKVNE